MALTRSKGDIFYNSRVYGPIMIEVNPATTSQFRVALANLVRVDIYGVGNVLIGGGQVITIAGPNVVNGDSIAWDIFVNGTGTVSLVSRGTYNAVIPAQTIPPYQQAYLGFVTFQNNTGGVFIPGTTSMATNRDVVVTTLAPGDQNEHVEHWFVNAVSTNNAFGPAVYTRRPPANSNYAIFLQVSAKDSTNTSAYNATLGGGFRTGVGVTSNYGALNLSNIAVRQNFVPTLGIQLGFSAFVVPNNSVILQVTSGAAVTVDWRISIKTIKNEA